MYYLQSRYYDPNIGRFINADAFASTGQGFLGCNMFAYCGNNPVAYTDPSGTYMTSNVNLMIADGGGGIYAKEAQEECINGQGLEPYASIAYGISTIGFSGCEAIAIYNSIILSGGYYSFSDIIDYIGTLLANGGGYGLYGLGGATCADIQSTLNYFDINYSWADFSGLSVVDDYTVMIVGFWTKTTIINDSITVPSIHTVAVEYADGKYCVYNYYNNSSVTHTFVSLEQLINGEGKFIYGFIIEP